MGLRLVAFFGCIYYAAMRPSEVLALRESDLALPAGSGWGKVLLHAGDPEVSGHWSDEGVRKPKTRKQRAKEAVAGSPAPHSLLRSSGAHPKVRDQRQGAVVQRPEGRSHRLAHADVSESARSHAYAP
jgi:integrase